MIGEAGEGAEEVGVGDGGLAFPGGWLDLRFGSFGGCLEVVWFLFFFCGASREGAEPRLYEGGGGLAAGFFVLGFFFCFAVFFFVAFVFCFPLIGVEGRVLDIVQVDDDGFGAGFELGVAEVGGGDLEAVESRPAVLVSRWPVVSVCSTCMMAIWMDS